MTPQQLRDTENHYCDMFAMDISDEDKDLLEGIDTADELDGIEDQISAGLFDAAEAILLGLT